MPVQVVTGDQFAAMLASFFLHVAGIRNRDEAGLTGRTRGKVDLEGDKTKMAGHVKRKRAVKGVEKRKRGRRGI